MAPHAEKESHRPNRREGEASRLARQQILDAALPLFARNGIDAVSLREISREAGYRNVGAVQYHFTTKENLIRAILMSRSAPIEAERLRSLDALEGLPSGSDIRGAVDAFLLPLAALLRGDQHDRAFVIFLFQIHVYAGPLFRDLFGEVQSESVARLYALIRHLLKPRPNETVSRRFDFLLDLTFSALARRARAIGEGRLSLRTHDRFVRDLRDSAVGVLLPPET